MGWCATRLPFGALPFVPLFQRHTVIRWPRGTRSVRVLFLTELFRFETPGTGGEDAQHFFHRIGRSGI